MPGPVRRPSSPGLLQYILYYLCELGEGYFLKHFQLCQPHMTNTVRIGIVLPHTHTGTHTLAHTHDSTAEVTTLEPSIASKLKYSLKSHLITLQSIIEVAACPRHRCMPSPPHALATVFQVCADALTGVFKVTSIWHRFQPVQLVLFDTRPFLTRDSPLRLAAMSCSTAAMVGRGGGTGGWGGLTQLAKFSQCHHRFGSCARTQGAEQHGS